MKFFLTIAFDSPILLIWAACIGFNIAMIFTFVFKKIQGEFISKLLEKEATSKEKALSLENLGYSSKKINGKILAFLLHDGSILRKLVRTDKDEEPQSDTNGEKSTNCGENISRDKSANCDEMANHEKSETDIDSTMVSNAESSSHDAEIENGNNNIKKDSESSHTESCHKIQKENTNIKKERYLIDFCETKLYLSEKDLSKAKSFKMGAFKWYFLPIYVILSVIIAEGIVLLLPFMSR